MRQENTCVWVLRIRILFRLDFRRCLVSSQQAAAIEPDTTWLLCLCMLSYVTCSETGKAGIRKQTYWEKTNCKSMERN